MTRGRTTRMVALAAVTAAGVVLAGCGETSESSDAGGDPAATLEEVKAPDGTELHRVTLTERAVERLGIRLEPISQEAGALVVPYAALVYDPTGGTWVYTQPKPRTFLRRRVTVREIAGQDAHLLDGPGAGTEVVTRGTPELYGAEEEIGA